MENKERGQKPATKTGKHIGTTASPKKEGISQSNPEHLRLQEHYSGAKNWLRWGPYLSERQWGTVREDYSEGGTAWDSFPHDHARSRVYRWGEDGIAGISDEWQRLCFSVALWNGKDPILKERLFGLTGSEGNHGEDVKELYYYLDSTPTHSYMKHLYKYPQGEFPYSLICCRKTRDAGMIRPNTNCWKRAFLLKTVIGMSLPNTPRLMAMIF